MEVKNHINNTLATAKRWPRPLNRGGRWIEVSNTTVYWQINRDFGKWPLNVGWPLNRWPLNRGRTVQSKRQNFTFRDSSFVNTVYRWIPFYPLPCWKKKSKEKRSNEIKTICILTGITETNVVLISSLLLTRARRLCWRHLGQSLGSANSTGDHCYSVQLEQAGLLSRLLYDKRQ